jgi:protein-S-isoprenylcysteine O-methyltransferase Ste14
LALVLVYFRFLIRPEEHFLAERHGDAYREYARSVSRLWTWRRGDTARHAAR